MARPCLWLGEEKFDVEIDSGQNLRALKAWYDTPAVKLASTDRVTGDGAFEPYDKDILYAARTLTLTLVSINESREAATKSMVRLGLLLHRNITVRVVDGAYDTWATGYVTFEFPETYDESFEFTATVVCSNPARYSAIAKQLWLTPASREGGFKYPVGYPVSYGTPVAAQNVGNLTNDGNNDADLIFEVEGSFPEGFSILVGQKEIRYVGPVFFGAPVVINSYGETAQQGATPVSHQLSKRGFTPVKPGQNMRIQFNALGQSAGTGWCKATLFDTFI